MSENKDSRGSSSCFLLGALLGAGLFFLFGTEEGKKVKNQLVKKGKGLIDDFPEIVKDLEKQGEEFVQKAEEVKKNLEKKTKDFSSSHRRFFVKKGKKLG